MCFRVRTESGDHTSGPVTYGVSHQGLESLSATLDMSSSVQQISVWVESENPLGSAESAPLNYTLRDIGETGENRSFWVLSLSLVMRNFCFRNSDANSSRSQPSKLLLSRVHRPRGAACEDGTNGDPVQVAGRSMDVASSLGEMPFIEKEKPSLQNSRTLNLPHCSQSCRLSVIRLSVCTALNQTTTTCPLL